MTDHVNAELIRQAVSAVSGSSWGFMVAEALASLQRQIDDLNSVVRRRNETITQLQAQLRESTVGSTLSNLAEQLGLTADQASKALELGSYLVATGIRRTDIDLWREMEMRFLRHRAEKGRTE